MESGIARGLKETHESFSRSDQGRFKVERKDSLLWKQRERSKIEKATGGTNTCCFKRCLIVQIFNRFNIVQSVAIDKYDSDICKLTISNIRVSHAKLQYTSTKLTSSFVSGSAVQLHYKSYSLML